MESELLSWLRQRLPTHPQLRLGPGDDAALLRLVHERECAVTTDLLSDGIDFELAQHSPRRIGHKALAVNLSDIAAMAAKPVAAFVSLLLPQKDGFEIARGLYEGMLPLAERYDVCIAGGDTNSWNGPLVISITLFGEVPTAGPLLRSGAKPGDRIIVTGEFGSSIIGKHLDFEPRVHESMYLKQNFEIHAGIDVSDGLSCDLNHICEASSCGAVLETGNIPISSAAYCVPDSYGPKISALEHALTDGEDFELILAVPPAEAARMFKEAPPFKHVKLTDIGCFVKEQGMWLQDTAGAKTIFKPRGYEHKFS